jgi:hypothetical protein
MHCHLAPWMLHWMPHWAPWWDFGPATHGALIATVAVSGGFALAGLERASRRLRRDALSTASRVSAQN